MSFKSVIAATGITLGTIGMAGPGSAQENVMIVFDGSNSMWGQIEGVSKIEIARDTIGALLEGWTEDRQVGLMAYGHRKRGDCGDIETLVEPQSGAIADIVERVKAISPRGKTPLTDAVEAAATALSYEDTPATVVLISDGLESCDRDPCALAKALEQGGVGFTAHVVGFGIGSDQDVGSLSCLAEETGGVFIEASNATELQTALSNVSEAVAQAPAAEPEPEPEPAPTPEPEAEPQAPEVIVTGPASAVEGSKINVSWEPTVDAGDSINIVPVGTPEGEFGRRARVGDTSDIDLVTPSGPGAYEIRYSLITGETYGFAAMEVTRARVDLTAEDELQAGADFPIAWSNTIHERDFVTIVPAGSPAERIGTHIRPGDAADGTLTAPGDPGLYELRYVLHADKKVVGTKAVEVTDSLVEITAPDTVAAGSQFTIGWTPTINSRDFLTIVAADAPGNEVKTHIRSRDVSEGILTAPGTPGIYEVRYVLDDGRKTVGSRSVEVLATKVNLTGPDQVATGSQFEIGWSPTINPRDLLTIVPAGSPAKTVDGHIRSRNKSDGLLTAPAQPGLYELRYVLEIDRSTVASRNIEVTEPEVTLSVVETALSGSRIEVSWTGAVNARDMVTIVPMGSPEGEIQGHIRVRGDSSGELQSPAETGLFEVRYVLDQGRKTMARATIELSGAEVTISGPEQVRTGEVFDVSWTGTVDARDYVTIVPSGSDEGTFGEYSRVREVMTKSLRAPASPGLYELRYVLEAGSKTMATAMIEVVEPEVAVIVQSTAVIGEPVLVSWTGKVSDDDYIAIVPKGAAEGEFGNYSQVRKHLQRALTAPADPGMYEVRYILRQGNKTLARADIELVAAEVNVSGPEQVRAKSEMTVSWTPTVNEADYIVLAPVGSPDNDFSQYFSIRGQTERAMKTPETPGLYELRYVLKEGTRVLARQMIDVVPETAALNDGAMIEAPDAAAAGSLVPITWQVEQASSDQRLTLAAPDQAIFTWITAQKMNGLTEVEIKMPDAPGIYELRILDVPSQSVLAQRLITVE
ncbi:MAG: vWA domain-containing protein [Pseudomonadota bacterium]